MGLLVGVGTTRPTYAYDYYYGVEWDVTVSNPKPTSVCGDASFYRQAQVLQLDTH